MTYHASCTHRDTSHDIEARDQILHPFCMGIKFSTPGKAKRSNARGWDVEASRFDLTGTLHSYHVQPKIHSKTNISKLAKCLPTDICKTGTKIQKAVIERKKAKDCTYLEREDTPMQKIPSTHN